MSAAKRVREGDDQLNSTAPAKIAKSMSLNPRGAYIVGYARTPVGDFQGSISSVPAPKLGACAIKKAIAEAGVNADQVDEVIMGNVLSAGLGQAPARQAALFAGLPDTTPATTVNKVCSSGMKAAMYAAQAIMCGQAQIIVAGGMENMSSVPHLLTKSRTGYRLGNGELVDGMIKDGLWDITTDQHMGSCAEECASRHSIGREAQDAFTVESYRRAAEHQSTIHADRIAAVEVPPARGRGDPTIVDKDERVTKGVNPRLQTMRPYFQPNGGTVTAGNASPLSDGAAALVIASGEAVTAGNLTPIAEIVSFADAARTPAEFTDAPADAIPRALKNGNINAADVDLYEVNEAFSVVALANNKLLSLDASKVNIAGGAVALGHPLGCSGARVICTLLSALQHTGGSLGVAGICNGGGGASALTVRLIKA